MATLHPDLVEYIDKVGPFKMVRHPLVVMLYHDDEMVIDHINQLYEYRKLEKEKAEEEEDYGKYIFIHERPWRLTAFFNIEYLIPDDQRPEIIREIWVDTENFWQFADDWIAILEPYQGLDAFNTLEMLPEEIIIYRGGTKDGLSWTLDLDKAKWFAKRYNKDHDVWKSKVHKKDVIAWFTERDENEILILPTSHTKITKVRK